MTVSIKRSIDQVGQPTKRLQSDPIEAVPHETPWILGRLTIRDLGSYACTSKASYESSHQFFLIKAGELGLKAKNGIQAMIKIGSLFRYIQSVKEQGTIEEIAFQCTEWTFSKITDFLSDPNTYKDPEFPVLELLESKERLSNPIPTIRRNDWPEEYKIRKALSYATYFRKPLFVTRLLEMGADPNLETIIKHPELPGRLLPTPLKIAILREENQSMRLLLNQPEHIHKQECPHSRNIDGIDCENPGLSVLQCALGSTKTKAYHPEARLNIELVQHLLEQGAIVQREDLMDAAESCSIEALQLLMRFRGFDGGGADVAFSRVLEVTMKHNTFAIDSQSHQMLEFLLTHGARIDGFNDIYPLHEACAAGSLELVKFLVSKNPDLSLPNTDDLSALSVAVLRGAYDIVQFLLEQGADVNQKTVSADDPTPIGTALACTCYMADQIEGYTPESNEPKLVKLLLAYGAEITLEEDYPRESPLRLAKENGLTEIVRIFEEHLASKAEGAS